MNVIEVGDMNLVRHYEHNLVLYVNIYLFSAGGQDGRSWVLRNKPKVGAVNQKQCDDVIVVRRCEPKLGGRYIRDRPCDPVPFETLQLGYRILIIIV